MKLKTVDSRSLPIRDSHRTGHYLMVPNRVRDIGFRQMTRIFKTLKTSLKTWLRDTVDEFDITNSGMNKTVMAGLTLTVAMDIWHIRMFHGYVIGI